MKRAHSLPGLLHSSECKSSLFLNNIFSFALTRGRRLVSIFAAAATIGILGTLWSLPASAIEYIYDELGRVVGVVSPSGESARYNYDNLGNIVAIDRFGVAAISILEFTPNSGPVGTSVSINGTGFRATVAQNTVKFNGVAATIASATTTKLVVTVPATATTGKVSVTSPAGTATSAADFVIAAATAGVPTVTGFTPTIGPAGTVVTISGTNFQADRLNNKVSINGLQLKLTAATPTSITAVVPTNMGSGKIKVTTPYGSALSLADYYCTPSPYTAADVEVTARMANPGAKAITIATPGKVAMVLFDGIAGERVGLFLSGVTIPNSTVTIYRPDGAVYSSISVGTGGGSIAVNPLPSTGTYSILVAPASSGTGNMTLYLGDTPDLVVSSAAVGTVILNTDGTYTFPVTYTVTNQGAIQAQNTWYDTAFLSVDGTLDNLDQSLSGQNIRTTLLAPGASYATTINYTTTTATAGGNYTLILKTDGNNSTYTGGAATAQGKLIEANETNNTLAKALTIALPDLVVTSATLGTVILNTGGTYTIPVTYTVTNQGAIQAQNTWYDTAFLSVNSTLDDTDQSLSGQNIRTTLLAPGASYTATINYTTTTATAGGNYTLILKTDGNNSTYTGGAATAQGKLIEANETNNTAAKLLTLP